MSFCVPLYITLTIPLTGYPSTPVTIAFNITLSPTYTSSAVRTNVVGYEDTLNNPISSDPI